MSTRAILERAVKEGLLCHLIPALGQPTRRTMLVHEELARLLADRFNHRSIGAMRGYLESFVTGGAITMGFTPRQHGPARMGRLDPISEGTWDFRCVDPSPATRVFGRFVCADVFIALEWAPRSKRIPGIDRSPLGNSDSLEWHIALGETSKRWTKIVPELRPLLGNHPGDYIRENATKV